MGARAMTDLQGAGHRPTLEVDELTVSYRHLEGWYDAVRDVSLVIHPGQVQGLVGESGSGKTTFSLAIMRYLGRNAKVRAGSIQFEGQDLLTLSESQLRQLWGSGIALVPQETLGALNPSMRIGDQLTEGVRARQPLTRAQARSRSLEMLSMVRIPDPRRTAARYPHQISGGMQQRVLVAMALSAEPGLLLLDEPTTGLDATTEAVVLDLFRELMRERRTATLYVSHNLGVVAQFADRVAVLYASELMEDAPTGGLFRRPLHPYTQGLLDSVPRLGESKRQIELRPIAGQIPSLGSLPPACVYAPRCPFAIELCIQERPKLETAQPGWQVRCHRWPEIQSGELQLAGAERLGRPSEGTKPTTVLRVEDLAVHYPLRHRPSEWIRGRPPRRLQALAGVDLALARGRTLGLVGESGSGKTSLARAVVGLVEPSQGVVEVLGVALPGNLSQRTASMLKQVQLVFQNPEAALNPYRTVEDTLRRSLKRPSAAGQFNAETDVDRLLGAVRLPPDTRYRYPAQLSGGEKQRVAIARAIAGEPELLICDEPVSSLDVSVQVSILKLLDELQVEQDLSLLFISHDLAVVGYIADAVGVLYLGQLMEYSEARVLFDPPYHPYTEALLSAVPLLDPEAEQARIRLEGDLPSAVDVPQGCPFHTRCPRFLGEVCRTEPPPWQQDDSGKRIYCHIPLEDLLRSQTRAFRMRGRMG